MSNQSLVRFDDMKHDALDEAVARELPIEIVWHTLGYLRYSQRIQLITREWLKRQMCRRVRLNKWRSKVRMYVYIKVFSQASHSWRNFCKETLQIKCRSRNSHFRLTWEAAASYYFRRRCRGCGRKTNALVFGWNICLGCRRNPRLPECFMVSVAEAKTRGIPKRILDTIPWHGFGRGPHLRFWKDIQASLSDDCHN